MSARRTERLLNLVICLLATRRWLTKEQIRQSVPQYQDCDTDEAFERMFERDKDDLRELGVPLITGATSSLFEDEVGYRIPPEKYELPPIDLTPEELAVLGLASRVWQQASLAGPAAQALVKLQALGVETDDDSLIGIEPRVRTAEPAFQPLYAATRDGAPVSFAYRKPSPDPDPAPGAQGVDGAPAADGAPADGQTRRLEPWRLVSRGGHWYVVGFDRDRGERRTFRLSRIVGAVRRIGAPGSFTVPDRDPAGGRTEEVRGFERSLGRGDDRIATIRVREGRAWSLRRRAERIDPGADGHPGASWDEVSVRVGDVDDLSEEIAWFGPDAVVLGPGDLRAAVIRRLRGVVRAHADADADPGRAAEPLRRVEGVAGAGS
jgi:proteasome accessory factor B